MGSVFVIKISFIHQTHEIKNFWFIINQVKVWNLLITNTLPFIWRVFWSATPEREASPSSWRKWQGGVVKLHEKHTRSGSPLWQTSGVKLLRCLVCRETGSFLTPLRGPLRVGGGRVSHYYWISHIWSVCICRIFWSDIWLVLTHHIARISAKYGRFTVFGLHIPPPTAPTPPTNQTQDILKVETKILRRYWILRIRIKWFHLIYDMSLRPWHKIFLQISISILKALEKIDRVYLPNVSKTLIYSF